MTWVYIAIGIALLSVVFYVVRLIRNAGNVLSYIAMLLRGQSSMRTDEARSLSSAGELPMPRIKRDFPEYNAVMVLNRVKNDARTYLESARQQRVLFCDGISDQFRERIPFTMPRDVMDGVNVHKAVLSGYDDKERDRVLNFQAAAEYMDKESEKQQVRLTLKYIAAYSGNINGEVRGFNCPNCGAPLPIVGKKICSYCRAEIKTAAGLGWVLTDVTIS